LDRNGDDDGGDGSDHPVKLALEKGDATAVAAEAGKILVALPDLKKSQRHKNVDQREKFVELATNLEKTVSTTVSLAKNGDLAGARTAFKKAEDTCVACHALFRD
jgi:cytochrome c556